MEILVAYATRHGATRGIADRIAAVLDHRGAHATVREVDATVDLSGYDAFVVGSAVYLGQWRKEAREFVRRNGVTLRARPTWLFSSGPLRVTGSDAEADDPRAAAEASELKQLRCAEELRDAAQPREHRVFFGVLDPSTLGVAERLMRVLPGGRALLPEGDFRDWDRIESWAATVADQLTAIPETGGASA
jgi:menaquinone-dependent protoporphyrinogen oxidase